MDDLTNRVHIRQRVARGAHRVSHRVHEFQGALIVGHIHDGRKIALDPAIAGILYHADDLRISRIGVLHGQAPAHWVFRAEVGFGEQLADHRNLGRAKMIAIVDLPAQQQRDFHGCEKLGSDEEKSSLSFGRGASHLDIK